MEPRGKSHRGAELRNRRGSPRSHSRAAALGLALSLYCLPLDRGKAEDHVDYRFESYQEDAGRILVNTQTALFEAQAASWLALRGSVVYDAISGATPTGAPPPAQINFPFPPATPLSARVPTLFMKDKRWAGAMESAFTFGAHHLSPEFSYSSEHDYLSYGGALNYALDLNKKNTTLRLGWAHDWDTILPNAATYITDHQHKDTDHFLVGLDQLLGPKTVLTVDAGFTDAHGYLSDPYRGVLFDDYPQFDPSAISLFPENRPNHRQSYTGLLALRQYVTPLHASVEGSYRYYRDTFGIDAHTTALAWHQKIGQRIVITPLCRYYWQTAASFYRTHFPGDPTLSLVSVPTFYSADYRLSEMETVTGGVEINIFVSESVSLDLGFKRFASFGLDRVTSPTAYPKANIYTIGARVWF